MTAFESYTSIHCHSNKAISPNCSSLQLQYIKTYAWAASNTNTSVFCFLKINVKCKNVTSHSITHYNDQVGIYSYGYIYGRKLVLIIP